MKLRNTSHAVIALMCVAATCFAQDQAIRVPAVFADNMVVQQQRPIPVWGTAAPGEQITVGMAGALARTTAGADGAWSVELPALPAGGPYQMSIAGRTTLTVDNVAVGEVWICSGQSNMEWPLYNTENGMQAVAEADYPMMRRLRVEHTVAGKPQDDLTGSWAVVSPDTMGGWQGITAVGYYFGRKLHRDLDVPVGLIQTSWGGTPAESWTPRTAMEAHEELSRGFDYWDRINTVVARELDEYAEKLTEWRQAAAEAETEGRPLPAMPEFEDRRRSPWRPTGLYNAMIHPLVRIPVRGAIWYQGESNAGRAPDYSLLFKTMIRSWREAWGDEDMPFLFVQLANFRPNGSEDAWAYLREDQTDALELSNTGMAVTIDIGNPTDIHPRNKVDVGERLALAAEAIAYGRDVVYSGPLYESMEANGNTVELAFTHVGGGLTADGGQLTGFTIAGADRRFVEADARISGDKVLVRSDEVAEPVAVRYGWHNDPDCSLFNKEGLPASPFRTDDWEPGAAQ
jgi:sialate O-acetylesterase